MEANMECYIERYKNIASMELLQEQKKPCPLTDDEILMKWQKRTDEIERRNSQAKSNQQKVDPKITEYWHTQAKESQTKWIPSIDSVPETKSVPITAQKLTRRRSNATQIEE